MQTPIKLNKMQFGFMPGKGNRRRDIHCEENAGRISKEGQEVV